MTRPASAVLAASIAAVSGCAGLSTPEAVRDRVSSVTGNAYERTGGITIGRGVLSFARAISVDQPLTKIQVGVYKSVEAKVPSRPGRSLSTTDFRGWEAQLAIQGEEGEDVLLLTSGAGKSVKRMLLVVDREDELVVVLLDGDLDTILEEAKRIAFEEAEVPEPEPDEETGAI